jgi:DNA-binding XRE family transcriptional regulator
MAEKIGCSRATYSAIERGTRNGALTFWRKLQAAFDITDYRIGGLMRNDEN